MFVVAIAIPLVGLLGLAYSVYRYRWVARQDPGSDAMQRIAVRIQRGAMAFLRAEYTVLLGFLLVVGALLLASSQSRSSSLIEVLDRVRSSTRLTITAQYRPGPAEPSDIGLPGVTFM